MKYNILMDSSFHYFEYRIKDLFLLIVIEFTTNEILGINLYPFLNHEEIKQKIKNIKIKKFSQNIAIENELNYIEDLIQKFFQGEEINHLQFLNRIFENEDLYPIISEFKKTIYRILSETKRGDLLTYSDIAEKFGKNAFQAIGSAMKNNNFPILIPCHRVVSKQGIGGYMGEYSKLKNIDNLIKTIKEDFVSLLKKNISLPIILKLLLIEFEKR